MASSSQTTFVLHTSREAYQKSIAGQDGDSFRITLFIDRMDKALDVIDKNSDKIVFMALSFLKSVGNIKTALKVESSVKAGNLVVEKGEAGGNLKSDAKTVTRLSAYFTYVLMRHLTGHDGLEAGIDAGRAKALGQIILPMASTYGLNYQLSEAPTLNELREFTMAIYCNSGMNLISQFSGAQQYCLALAFYQAKHAEALRLTKADPDRPGKRLVQSAEDIVSQMSKASNADLKSTKNVHMAMSLVELVSDRSPNKKVARVNASDILKEAEKYLASKRKT